MKHEKCTFRATEVDFLGMIVRRDRIKMDQEKVKAILEWPEPKMVKGVRSFLGLANFYQRFIKDYAKVARPLHDLMKKENPFRWEESQQVAFVKQPIKQINCLRLSSRWHKPLTRG